VVTDKSAATKAIDEAVVKVAADAAAMKAADQGAAAAKTTVGSVGYGSGSYPAPVVGSKRADALGGSTPPSKQFRCA
jgi:hypothetical protein